MKQAHILTTALLLFVAFTSQAEPQKIKRQVSEIVADFAKWSDQQLGDNNFDNKPSVQIKASPYLIYIDRKENRITVPDWETTPKEVQNLFTSFSPKEQVQELFELCFNHFFVAHEAAHWLQYNNELNGTDYYQTEQMANRIAVEFWSATEAGKTLLDKMASYADHVLSVLVDPTPADTSPEIYFTNNYRTLGVDAEKYAFYQFYFVRKAIKEQDQFTVQGIVDQNRKKTED